jgi:hypothetical protein
MIFICFPSVYLLLGLCKREAFYRVIPVLRWLLLVGHLGDWRDFQPFPIGYPGWKFDYSDRSQVLAIPNCDLDAIAPKG